MTDLSPETPRIKWRENVVVAFVSSMIIAVSYWIITGEPLGGLLWCACAGTAFANCAWYDVRAYRRRALATGDQ